MACCVNVNTCFLGLRALFGVVVVVPAAKGEEEASGLIVGGDCFGIEVDDAGVAVEGVEGCG